MCSFRSGFGSNVCGLVCLCPSLPACVLSGVICLHVNDMLEIGDDVFESKMKELDEVVGFGLVKRQKFDQCRSEHEEQASGENHEAYIQNMKKASMTLDRADPLDRNAWSQPHNISKDKQLLEAGRTHRKHLSQVMRPTCSKSQRTTMASTRFSQTSTSPNSSTPTHTIQTQLKSMTSTSGANLLHQVL